MTPIGIFAATRWESNAVRAAIPIQSTRVLDGVRCWVGDTKIGTCWIVQTGIGGRRAEAIARTMARQVPLDVMVSTGFAGALVPAHIGDLLIGTEVTAEAGVGAQETAAVGITCSSEWHTKAVCAGEAAGLTPRVGPFVSTTHVVGKAEDKYRLSRGTRRIGLDMESAAIGTVAQQQGFPFIIVRAVSDLADEDLPLDFNRLLKPTGWPMGLLWCLAKPSRVLELRRLYAHSRIASSRLTKFFEAFLNASLGRDVAGPREDPW